MSEEYSEKHIRARRFAFVLPVLIVPIVSVFFWLLGGGKASGSAAVKSNGMNMQLPDAPVNKDSTADKMAFYMAADADSSKRIEQMRMDPYRQDTSVARVQPAVDRTYEVPDALAGKIAAIKKRVVRGEVETVKVFERKNDVPVHKPVEYVPDPEMEAINGTLDKLMAIQNPQKAVVKNTVVADVAQAVSLSVDMDSTYFGKKKPRKAEFLPDVVKPNVTTISAVIPVEQILQNGSLVKMELNTPVTIKGIIVPAGTNVFGIAALDGERLIIRIPSIQYQANLLAVALSVYDLDGLEGIYIPGAVWRDVAKSSGDNAIQSAGSTGFDLSLKTQAVAAGVGAAKSFLSKKVKQQRVTLSSGYRVLLFDMKQGAQ
jgi:hypothetical protein